MEAKKKRAVKIIKAVQKLEPYLKKKGVSVLVVNMQNDRQNVVDEVIALAGSDHSCLQGCNPGGLHQL
jgi:hypothetical protein